MEFGSSAEEEEEEEDNDEVCDDDEAEFVVVTPSPANALIHARSALQRSIAVQDLTSAEKVTRIILDLANAVAEAARAFIQKNSESALTTVSTGESGNKNIHNTRVASATTVATGIAAAESVRIVVEPLIVLARAVLLNKASNNENTTVGGAAAVENVRSAQSSLSRLQAEALAPWKECVRDEFVNAALQRNGYADVVVSGGNLVCRCEHSLGAAASSNPSTTAAPTATTTTAASVEYPCQPSPALLSALVRTVRRVTSSLLLLSNNNASSSNTSNNSTTKSSCPTHVRLELSAEMCTGVLQQGIAMVDSIKNAAAAATSSSSSSSSPKSTSTPAITDNERDQRLLQLYFDVCYTVLVLRGASTQASSPSTSSVFATVDSLRKEFAKKIEGALDVVTWSVSKSLVHSALKQAIENAVFVTTVLPSVGISPTTSSSSPSSSSSTTATKLGARSAYLQPATEILADRLTLLPLIALSTSAGPSSSSAIGVGGVGGGLFGSAGDGSGVGGGGGVGGVAGGFASALFGDFGFGGGGSAVGGAGGATGVAGGGVGGSSAAQNAAATAQQLLAQGTTALTKGLKSVFQW